MKSRHLPLWIILITAMAFVSSLFILQHKEDKRYEYEKFLLKEGKKADKGEIVKGQGEIVTGTNDREPGTRNPEPGTRNPES